MARQSTRFVEDLGGLHYRPGERFATASIVFRPLKTSPTTRLGHAGRHLCPSDRVHDSKSVVRSRRPDLGGCRGKQWRRRQRSLLAGWQDARDSRLQWRRRPLGRRDWPSERFTARALLPNSVSRRLAGWPGSRWRRLRFHDHPLGHGDPAGYRRTARSRPAGSRTCLRSRRQRARLG